MKITLDEAVALRGIISKRIQELIKERNSVSVVETTPGEEYEKPSRTVEEVTAELNASRQDFRKLDVLMAKTNLENFLTWDGEEISITEAIELAKQIRGEVNALKNFAIRKKQERKTNWQNVVEFVVHTLYDPEDYRKQYLKLERQVNKLSANIAHKNHLVEIDFLPASKYLEV